MRAVKRQICHSSVKLYRSPEDGFTYHLHFHTYSAMISFFLSYGSVTPTRDHHGAPTAT